MLSIPSRSDIKRSQSIVGRRGALLLDLFLATVIFTLCAITLGELGIQSLRVSDTNNRERWMAIYAESILATELAIEQPIGIRKWLDQWNGISIRVEVERFKTDLPTLQRIHISVESGNHARVHIDRLISLQSKVAG